MLSEELLAVLACPRCRSRLVLERENWLVCQNPECACKYPIKDGIPNLLVEEGERYRNVSVDELVQIP